MPIAVAAKITALLTGLTRVQVGAMAPADRQQLASECERVWRLAQPEGSTVSFRPGAGEHAQAGK
jgi:hypothetical protein